ncbi:hypothetical protein M011DRAFT_465097 [Sporormia fimetaria CBS 119925]|uniref:ISWI chromatin-remodeling complex ATPase ISW2 n=1 Tax=Sporormia fimetaria CBS 119925 TaxID=1340428 RepID=A0A6A6VI75_9PLEO|nr:hypothetical protein M011DRAFT_465097 [Sporormia fimetaria CBS 119925]
MDKPAVTKPFASPSTPQRRTPSTSYQDLLQSFGSRRSATSVTKARRLAGNAVSAQNSLASVQLSKPETVKLDPFATPPSETPELPEKGLSRAMSSSEDELAVQQPPKLLRATSSTAAAEEDLKMEKYKRATRSRAARPSRTTRTKDSDILASDMQDELSMSPAKKPRTPLRRKPDTARQRLRDEIAAQTKAKAENFLAFHKDLFLPLLPPNNHVAKLTAAEPIVEYKELKQPHGVTATLKPYQLSGLSFLLYLHDNGFSGILGDEMGLGKTLQTLSLFQYLEERDQEAGMKSEVLRPYLVVCPLSVLNSWVAEAHRWVPDLKVLRFHGTVEERSRLKKVAMGVEDMYGNETKQSLDRKASRKAGLKVSKLPTDNSGPQAYKIVVTTYEAFQAEQTWFKHSFIWRYVVLDEGHKVKNSSSLISSALKSVSAEYRLILTGTPLQNNLTELWALLTWLYPDVFTAKTEKLFKDSFDLSRGQVNQQTMDDARGLLELIMLRRMKDSEGVDLNLPPKEEVLLYVPLTPMQRFWYTRLLTRVGDAILDDLFVNAKNKEKDALQAERTVEGETGAGPSAWQETADIMKQALQKEQDTKSSRWQRLMNLVLQLRKCCSHPYLIPGATPEPYYLGDHVIRTSGKFILLEKLLNHSIFKEKKKVLIFSGFTRTLDCCEDLLTLIGDHGRKFKFLRLDGSTGRARRNLDIRMFNQPDSDYKVMLLSTRAGGMGINLTAAEDVIFLDDDWNPQVTLQAEARAHRIGQTNKVTVYKLCTQGTVEEQMMGRIRKKLYLSAKITESMRNIHSEGGKGRGRGSSTEDMPQMDTTQLKALVRRGAQTLSHPQIDVTEMLSWDLDTMMHKCRDKPSDPQAKPDASATDIDEEQWLATMERVECAVFDGKRHQRKLIAEAESNILPSTISRGDRRKGKNVTVMVDGFAISKESLNCADWEAVPTFAGKDPRLAEPKREKKRAFVHEDHCLACFDTGELMQCKGCPRSYHMDCLEEEFQMKTRSLGGFFCAQHECVDCAKKTTDAGGLIYRCRWCENGFCEDCLDWEKVELIGENLPEFEMLGEGPATGAFFIKCPLCKDSMDEDPVRKGWILSMENSYKEQNQLWLQARDKEQREVIELREREEKDKQMKWEALMAGIPDQDDAGMLGHEENKTDELVSTKPSGLRLRLTKHSVSIVEESEVGSPPPLTDSSRPTPALLASGTSTPNLIASGYVGKRKGLPVQENDVSDASEREEKRPRLEELPRLEEDNFMEV